MKFSGLFLCLIVSISMLGGLFSDLSTLRPSCCCDELCECDHDKGSDIVFRNIQCGDSSSGINHHIFSKQLILPTLFDRYVSHLVHYYHAHSFSLMLPVSYILDPPPPKYQLS